MNYVPLWSGMWQGGELLALLLSICQITKPKQLVTSVMSFIQGRTIHESEGVECFTSSGVPFQRDDQARVSFAELWGLGNEDIRHDCPAGGISLGGLQVLFSKGSWG